MFKRKNTIKVGMVAAIVALSVGLGACSSSDDDDGGDDTAIDGTDGDGTDGDGTDGDGTDGDGTDGDGTDGDGTDGDGTDGDGTDGDGTDGVAPPPGSITMTFTNLSAAQPMTPPVAILHNAPGSENGIQFVEVGAPVSAEVLLIAEDGVFMPLLEVAEGQIGAGTVSAVGAAFADPANPGPLGPGASAELTLDVANPDQVLTIVTMVVCTNDGFTGVTARPLADGDETFMTPIYDAGSESNVPMADYWVPAPPCGGTETNMSDDENGVIALHPGQIVDSMPELGFETGTQILEVSVVRN